MRKVPKFRKSPKKPSTPAPRRVGPPIGRTQVFLPEFTITLINTPFLPPRYASFHVPLSLNKLDLRDYLRRAYGVRALSIRSYVEQQKVTRMRRDGKAGYGPLRRPKSKKRMTVELAEPFVWPALPEDMTPWEHDQFHKAYKYETEYQKKHQPDAKMKPDDEMREAFKNAADEVNDERGASGWRPTWQALGLNYDRTSLFKRGVMKAEEQKEERTPSTPSSGSGGES